MGEMIRVGMADAKLCFPPDAITTLGLGSCVGVVIYDQIKKISGMVHVMLPDSTTVRNNTNRAKFADTGVEDLLASLLKKGANRPSLVAKIAGGAQMFAFSTDSDMLRVGERNVQAVKKKLMQLGIKIIAEDTGDSYGRTIEFYPETAELLIKAVGKPVKTI